MAADPKSLGPECAVLTSIGTVYLYRLTQNDLRVFREMPATKLSIDKFRSLLTRIASTNVSEKGILDAGSLGSDEVESLSDDEVERLAESYLDSTTIRWYRHEGASATVSVIRNSNEPATKFLDRLIHWYAVRGPGRAPESAPKGDGLSTTAPYPRPRMVAPDMIVISRREAWFTLGALALLAVLGIGAFLQHYLLVQQLQKQQDALLAQAKETNATLGAFVKRSTEENAQLRARIDALEAALHQRSATPSAAAKPAAKTPTPAKTTNAAKPRTRR